MSVLYEDDNGQIYHGNALSLVQDIPFESIDLIITDPPYTKEFLYTYDILAFLGYTLLKESGSLITIVPQPHLPYVIEAFKNKLTYRWALCLNQFEGNHPRLSMGIEVTWKLMLWYVKGKFNRFQRRYVVDGVKINGKSGQYKSHHEWEQDGDFCRYYIRRLSEKGDIILDPFGGSGTVAVVAKELNRYFIICDSELEHCQTMIKRIESTKKGFTQSSLIKIIESEVK